MKISFQSFTKILIVMMALWAPGELFAALYKEKITIGTDNWPGYMPLYVAQDKGFFKEKGLDVEIKFFESPNELSEKYVAGELIGRGSVTLDAVKEAIDGLDHKIVMVIDYSNGADAIVSTTKIKSISQLKDKKVAIEKGSIQDFFLSWALAQKKMSLNSMRVTSTDTTRNITPLLNGSADVAVTHEPILSDVLSDHRFHELVNSSSAPGLIVDVLTLKTEFIEAHPESVKAFLDAYFKGLAFMKKKPDEASKILGKYIQIENPKSFKKQLRGIDMLDRKGNETAFTKSGYYWSLYNNMKIVDSYVRNQLKKSTTLNTRKLIDPQFFKPEA